MTTLPILEPMLPDTPDVWRALTAEQIAIANERDEYGLLTPGAMAVRKQAEMDRWYLVRNVFNWKSGKQGREGHIEGYFTTAGIERPYHGIWGIYAGYRSLVQNDDLAATMTLEGHQIGAHEPISIEQAQELYDRIRAKLGPRANIGPRPGSTERR